jgi:hypothetical protein
MALDENDISVIRDILVSSTSSVQSSIEGRISQILSGMSSSNTELSRVRNLVEDLRQNPISSGASGSYARRAGASVPMHSPGSSVPRDMTFAVEKATLLKDGAEKFSAYAYDLVSSAQTLSGYLASTKEINSEIKGLISLSRGNAKVKQALTEYVENPNFGSTLTQERGLIKDSLSSGGIEAALKAQALVDFKERLRTEHLAADFKDSNEFNRFIAPTEAVDLLKGNFNKYSRDLPQVALESIRRFSEVAKSDPRYFRTLGKKTEFLTDLLQDSNLNKEEIEAFTHKARRSGYQDELQQQQQQLPLTGTLETQIAKAREKIGEARTNIAVSSGKPKEPNLQVPELLGMADFISGLADKTAMYRAAGMPSEADEKALREAYRSVAGSGGKGLASLRRELMQAQAMASEGKDVQGNPLVGNQIEEQESLIGALNSLISALEKTGETLGISSENQSKATAGLISSVIGALSIQQVLMMSQVSHPYQYQTQPALGVMGSTGMMGETLSGAFGAQQAVRQSYLELETGTLGNIGGLLGGAAGFGIAGKMGLGVIGKAVSGTIGATALMAGGTLLGSQGFLTDMFSKKPAEEAFNANFAATMLNAQKLSQEFLLPTMQTRVNLGFLQGTDVNSAAALGDLASEGAKSLGYDAIVNSQILSAGLSMLRPGVGFYDPEGEGQRASIDTAEGSRGLINTIAQLEGFGMSKEAGFGLLSSFSAAGSEDITRSLDLVLAATSQEGDLNNFTLNVLAPALAKVVESRAIQNIAKSSEQVERESIGFFTFFKNSDTNLGRMLGATPELMSNIFGMLDQVGDTALQDPALMLFLNRMGVSYADVITGSPEALLKPMGLFAQYADYDATGEINLNSMSTISSLVGFLQTTGIGVSTGTMNITSKMFEAMNQARLEGREFSTSEYSAYMDELHQASPEGRLEDVLNQLEARLGDIAGSMGAGVTRRTVEETNRFFELMETNVALIGVIQDQIRDLLSNTAAMNDRLELAGLATINEIERIIGKEELTTLEGLRDLINPPVSIPIPETSVPLEEGSWGFPEVLLREAEDLANEQEALQRHRQRQRQRQRQYSQDYNDSNSPKNDTLSYFFSSLGNAEFGSLTNPDLIIQNMFSSLLSTTNFNSMDDFSSVVHSSFASALGSHPEGSANQHNLFDNFYHILENLLSNVTSRTRGFEGVPIPYTYDEFINKYDNNPDTNFKFNRGHYALDNSLGLLGGDLNILAGVQNQLDRDTNFTPGHIANSLAQHIATLPEEERGPALEIINTDLLPRFKFATGGYTGVGNRLDPVGVVHGGEYIISDNNVSGNFNTLQRMQAGERMDESSPFINSFNTGNNDVIRVVLEFSNTNPEAIIQAARMSAFSLLREERII